MAENASQSIKPLGFQAGRSRPPDPRGWCQAPCQPFPAHFQLGHQSNFGLDPPLFIPTLNVRLCFIPLHHGYYGFELKFTGHSFVLEVLPKKKNEKNKKSKKKKLKKMK